ncbi:MAG: hypothetical protein JW956_10520 [Calditrichaceae bacterium]|nr:hypothetical protein [Calditrichaceae bacterium]
MKKHIHKFAFILSMILLAGISNAQVELGADLVSRYVWRGTDFGNSASVQPYLSVGFAGLEAGAWASYPISASGANENDLYLSYAIGPVGITVTDYYFPGDTSIVKFGNYADDGNHILEASVSFEMAAFSAIGAMNFYGEDDNSMYFELGYEVYSKDDMTVSAFAGAGNKVYVTNEDGDFGLVNAGITASKGNLSASYIINADADVSFLVFGYSVGL